MSSSCTRPRWSRGPRSRFREHSTQSPAPLPRHELGTSDAGRAWQRPYRDTDLGFWSYADPFTIDGRMHFATWKDGAMVTVAYERDRMVAVIGPGPLRQRPRA